MDRFIEKSVTILLRINHHTLIKMSANNKFGIYSLDRIRIFSVYCFKCDRLQLCCFFKNNIGRDHYKFHVSLCVGIT